MIVVGLYAAAAIGGEIDALVSAGASVEVVTNPAGLPGLMAAADLAVFDREHGVAAVLP